MGVDYKEFPLTVNSLPTQLLN